MGLQHHETPRTHQATESHCAHTHTTTHNHTHTHTCTTTHTPKDSLQDLKGAVPQPAPRSSECKQDGGSCTGLPEGTWSWDHAVYTRRCVRATPTGRRVSGPVRSGPVRSEQSRAEPSRTGGTVQRETLLFLTVSFSQIQFESSFIRKPLNCFVSKIKYNVNDNK